MGKPAVKKLTSADQDWNCCHAATAAATVQTATSVWVTIYAHGLAGNHPSSTHGVGTVMMILRVTLAATSRMATCCQTPARASPMIVATWAIARAVAGT